MVLKLITSEPSGQNSLWEEENRYTEVLTKLYGERFLNYRKLWGEREALADPGEFPLSLDLAINSGCQLSCVMCPQATTKTKTRLMEKELIAKLLSEGEAYGLPAITVGLGSEPLLNPHAPDFLYRAYKAGVMDSRLGTNGLLLNADLIKKLLDTGLTRLEISVDAATSETYAKIRRQGDFSKLTQNIDLFLGLRAKARQPTPLLRLSFLKLPDNSHELNDFLARYRGLADLISLQNPIWFPETLLPEPSSQDTQPVPCVQPWQRLGILEDGSLWPCCSWYGAQLLNDLNATTQTLHSVWHGQTLRELRESHRSLKLPPACSRCRKAQVL
jgi:uncharacterized Fe-S cluster-containing radical SAM superfamily protein